LRKKGKKFRVEAEEVSEPCDVGEREGEVWFVGGGGDGQIGQVGQKDSDVDVASNEDSLGGDGQIGQYVDVVR
jgi:hypothetical protein